METNTIGWMDGTSSGSILRSDLGNKHLLIFIAGTMECLPVCLLFRAKCSNVSSLFFHLS